MDYKKRNLSRTDIEQILFAALHRALVRRNCPRDLQHERRILRAMVHLGVRRLLSMGVSGQKIADEIGTAFSREIQAFEAFQKKGGTRSGWGGPLALA